MYHNFDRRLPKRNEIGTFLSNRSPMLTIVKSIVLPISRVILALTRHPYGPVALDSPTVLRWVAVREIKPNVLWVRVLAQPLKMWPKVPKLYDEISVRTRNILTGKLERSLVSQVSKGYTCAVHHRSHWKSTEILTYTKHYYLKRMAHLESHKILSTYSGWMKTVFQVPFGLTE